MKIKYDNNSNKAGDNTHEYDSLIPLQTVRRNLALKYYFEYNICPQFTMTQQEIISCKGPSI